jgi:hypothetical protein
MVVVEVEVVGRNRNLDGSTVEAMMTLSAIREVDRSLEPRLSRG